MRWKLLPLVAWLVVGGGGWRMAVSRQPAPRPAAASWDEGTASGAPDLLPPLSQGSHGQPACRARAGEAGGSTGLK